MKTTKVKIIISSILILIITGCSSMKSTDLINSVISNSNFKKTEMFYGSHEKQTLDVYIPESKIIKTPIVFVYGGAWREGDKADFKFVAHALTSLGHPVIIPDYRPFPANFPDFYQRCC